MIKSWKHKGLENFFKTGSTSGIQTTQSRKLRLQLFALDSAAKPEDLNIPSWRLHKLKGRLENYWSISVNGNWRITFKFEGNDVILVDYQDYH